jgi:epoxyqueuosine reductase
MPISISEKLRSKAKAEGFDAVRITEARLPGIVGERLAQMVGNGWYGDMGWLAETLPRRTTPNAMWPGARSAVVFALSYKPALDPLARLQDRQAGVISVYALNRDYHDIVKGGLKRIGQWFAHETGAEVKVFVDTAPLMEKPLAAQAGLGWQGRHTNLVSRELGSWFFLGVLLTDAELAADAAETDHCGSCRACLDICPTKAFPAPYQLDARRCISYLTIEHKGHIAREFRPLMGNRIYGCDDCLAICPWNKFAVEGREVRLHHREDLAAPRLAGLAGLDDPAFRALFAGSPVKRIGRDRFVRNVLIAIGNSGAAELAPVAEKLAGDASPLVRAMAAWALARLDGERHARLAPAMAAVESDAEVRDEWSM